MADMGEVLQNLADAIGTLNVNKVPPPHSPTSVLVVLKIFLQNLSAMPNRNTNKITSHTCQFSHLSLRGKPKILFWLLAMELGLLTRM